MRFPSEDIPSRGKSVFVDNREYVAGSGVSELFATSRAFWSRRLGYFGLSSVTYVCAGRERVMFRNFSYQEQRWFCRIGTLRVPPYLVRRQQLGIFVKLVYGFLNAPATLDCDRAPVLRRLTKLGILYAAGFCELPPAWDGLQGWTDKESHVTPGHD